MDVKILWSNDFFSTGSRYDFTETDLYLLRSDNRGVVLPENIVVIADLGLWNRRRPACKELGTSLVDCFYSECDFVTWQIDKKGDLRATCSHHDGTNYYLYRIWKQGLTDIQKSNFLRDIRNGTATNAKISRYTEKIGSYIIC